MRTHPTPARWERIIKLIGDRVELPAAEIATIVGVSVATIRRDLAAIERRGLIERTWGGAEAISLVATGQPEITSRQTNALEKDRIGRAAAALIRPGERVMIDGGGTTLLAARYLMEKAVTLITTSITIAAEAAGRTAVDLVVIGGDYHHQAATTTGRTSSRQILDLAADKAILGADAIRPYEGISVPVAPAAHNKRAMMLRVREVIVVADHTKLGRVALYEVGLADRIKILVTDAGAPAGIVDEFRASGVKVIIAPNR